MWEIAISAVVALILAELTDISPWLARRLVRWSARIRYTDGAQAEVRAEELEALINERPGKLFKLGTGTRFAVSAAAVYARRHLLGEAANTVPGSDLRSLDDPSGLVARYLFATERYRGEWRRHWFHLAKAWLFGTAYAGLAIWAVVLRIKPEYRAWFITGIAVYYLAWLCYRLANWYFTRFVITNKRLLTTEGLMTRRVVMIPLIRVTDMRYEQSAVARMLGYGTFTLESADRRTSMRKIKDLPNPNELYLRVVEEMYEPAAVEARLGFSDEDGEETLPDPGLSAAEVESLNDGIAKLSQQIHNLTQAIQALQDGGSADQPKPEAELAVLLSGTSPHGGQETPTVA